ATIRAGKLDEKRGAASLLGRERPSWGMRSASRALVEIAWRPRVSVEESRLVREHDCLDAVAEVELLEDVGDVCLDGGVADVELFADLGVREAAGDQAEHVELALCQLVELFWRRGLWN